ncbi:tyrosine-type recombinase/integrase [Cupriavidus campinensis]|uniref:tyrosine-type recombinase/integrase n=1 Tax=Cupriavidus campinensis TaxID=151783 RepID=UPI0016568CA7|nr:tyrosine-type recombinase/integrase [Cupriavidus campinensis]
MPTVSEALLAYATAKKVKASSLRRYQSVLRTHFGDWLERPVSELKGPAFAEHCHLFAQKNGAAIVELGRGLVGSLLRYLHAVHGVEIPNPFIKLGAAGLLPLRALPRARKLKEADLLVWSAAVDKLPELHRDYLRLVLFTGLRKNECGSILREHVDLHGSVLLIPDTKGGKPHTLPITESMKEILVRRCVACQSGTRLFERLSVDHVAEMALRAGAPAFTLHDLRKLVATVGAKLGLSDAVLRRILGHAPKRADVLHRHYVSLDVEAIAEPMELIQRTLTSHLGQGTPQVS